MKLKFLPIVSLACLLLVSPVNAARRRVTTKTPATESTANPTPTPAPPPPTLAQLPVTPPQVSFHSGQLTISAQNSTLGDILKAVRAQTGATVELPGTAPERVVGHFGPAPPRDVLASLLNGSHFNYVLLGSPTDPVALDRVILMPKSGAGAESTPPPAVEQASAPPQVFTRAMVPMAAPPGGNTVVVEGEDGQDDTADDAADATDDAQTDDQTDQTDDQTTDDQQQQDGQQPVKTPEQLLQELQQRQQQLQQQGIQPGAAPGAQFPNPGGAPGQPGTSVPPHN